MGYTKQELASAKAEIVAFCTSEAQDGIMNRITDGQLSLHGIAIGLLNPIYFEVDESGEYGQHLKEFFKRLFGLEEVRRREGLIGGSPLVRILFDKTTPVAPEADENGERMLYKFCLDFLVLELIKEEPKKVAANLISAMFGTKNEAERERAKQIIIDAIIENETIADPSSKTGRKWIGVPIDKVKHTMSGDVCRALNATLFKSYCTDEFTDAAIEIMAIIDRHTRSIPVLLTGLAWSLENPMERERSAEILIKFGEKAFSFRGVSRILRRPMISDNEDVRTTVKRILVEVVKERCAGKGSPEEEKPFLDNILRPLVVILPDGERVRDVCSAIACATIYGGKVTDRLLKALENPELVNDAIIMMLELADARPETARFMSWGVVRKLDVENRDQCERRDPVPHSFTSPQIADAESIGVSTPQFVNEYNARLIRVAKEFIEKSPKWRIFEDALAEQLGSETQLVREKTIAFMERLLSVLGPDPAWNMMRRFAWGFASEMQWQWGGTAQLFDRIFDNERFRADATSAIAKEVYTSHEPIPENLKSGVNSYFEKNPRNANLVQTYLIKLATEDPKVREKLTGYLGDSHEHIRRMATIAYNLSSPGEKKVRAFRERRDGNPATERTTGLPNGSTRVHT